MPQMWSASVLSCTLFCTSGVSDRGNSKSHLSHLTFVHPPHALEQPLQANALA